VPHFVRFAGDWRCSLISPARPYVIFALVLQRPLKPVAERDERWFLAMILLFDSFPYEALRDLLSRSATGFRGCPESRACPATPGTPSRRTGRTPGYGASTRASARHAESTHHTPRDPPSGRTTRLSGHPLAVAVS
jgi:hypothetical protein